MEAAKKVAVRYKVIPDLAWAEIDDARHYPRAGDRVYSLIQERDSALSKSGLTRNG